MTRRFWRISTLVGGGLLAGTTAQATDRVRLATECRPAPEKLAYQCTLALSNARTGAPIEGAEVTVGADMPSMPLAHNVQPVPALPLAEPGRYATRLRLEMHGDWALKVTVTGPLRDQVVEVLNFGEAGSAPASKAGRGSGSGSGAARGK